MKTIHTLVCILLFSTSLLYANLFKRTLWVAGITYGGSLFLRSRGDLEAMKATSCKDWDKLTEAVNTPEVRHEINKAWEKTKSAGESACTAAQKTWKHIKNSKE